jgi:predicted lipoprotein with Yx(FWY)xxD motif
MLSRFRSSRFLVFLTVFSLVLGACASAAPSPTVAPQPTAIPNTGPTSMPTSAPAASQMQVVMTAQQATLGNFLTDDKGMTLYIYKKDAPGMSNCYDKCAAAWPPLLVPAGTAPTGVSGFTGKLGTTQRTDGTIQVTVNDQPVYNFAKDKQPGDVSGQGVGSVWYVLDPSGNIVSTMLATATAAPATQGATIMVAQNAALGSILTDEKGMTLYVYLKDTPGVSNCSGDCAGIWPPLTVPQGTTPTAGSGFSGTLGTIQRSDGTTQVTVNNMPVYTWVKDKNPGDTTGQGVGTVWYVLDPAGNVVKTALAAPSATPAASTQGATILVEDTANMGTILSDSKGMTLYVYTKDTGGTSTCYDQCAANWPALTVAQGVTPTAGNRFTGKLGTTQRTDGTLQVTVNGMPVYTFVKDKTPGDATGQGVGKVWYVIDASGNMMNK